MRSLACLMMSLSFLALAAGCGDDAEDEEHEHALPDVECADASVPSFDEVAAFDKCTRCHSSALSGDDRMDAPEDDNWDVYEEAAEHGEEIAHEVFEGAMPPEESGITLTAMEEEDLYLWALCGTPE